MGHLQHHKEVTDQMDMVIKYARQTSHPNIEKYSKLFDNERIMHIHFIYLNKLEGGTK